MEIIENNIDLNAYKTFYVVAKWESFSKAASELYISQPAVSYSIKKLEEELNTKLNWMEKSVVVKLEYQLLKEI